MDYIETPEGKIYYRIEGRDNNETLVLLHGLSADSAMFTPQIEYFKNYYKVIVPDLRGNGKSCELNCKVEKILDIQADDIRTILEKERIDKAFIGGTSYGGVLTIHMMVNFPELFKAAILCDTFCTVDMTPVLNSIAQLMAPLVKYSWFMKMCTLPIYVRWPQTHAYFNDLFNHIRANESVLQRRAIIDINYSELLKKSKISALLLAGDFSGKLVQMMKITEKCLSNCQSQVISNSFDPSNMCRPDIYNELVNNFIKEVLKTN